MHKSTRSKKIPTMVAVTIVGEDDAMYKAVSKAIQHENRKRDARGEEPVQYIINYNSALRPSMSPQEGESDLTAQRVAGKLLDELKKIQI